MSWFVVICIVWLFDDLVRVKGNLRYRDSRLTFVYSRQSHLHAWKMKNLGFPMRSGHISLLNCWRIHSLSHRLPSDPRMNPFPPWLKTTITLIWAWLKRKILAKSKHKGPLYFQYLTHFIIGGTTLTSGSIRVQRHPPRSHGKFYCMWRHCQQLKFPPTYGNLRVVSLDSYWPTH